MGRKKKVMQPKEEIAEDFCFVCKDGGLLQICDYRDCLKAYHPHCVGNDPSILEMETEWNCRWHSCFICHKGSSYRCLCCPISVCGHCIKYDAEFVPIKKKKTGLCNNCLKLAIMIEENADVDSDGGKVDFQDRATSEYLFKDYWEIVNEKEGLTLEDLHAADSRLKRHQVFESGSESDAEVLEEEMLTDVDIGLRDLRGGMKTPTKRYRSRKNTYLAWSSDESLEEGENSKKPQRIHSDSGPKSEQNHCKKKVPEQPKSEYAAIVEKNINSLYLRKSLALKLLADPETFEHKVTGCFVRVKVDPKNFYSFPYKLYQLGQVKGVKKVDHAYQVGEVNTDVVLCITNMKDVHISMLSDEDIEEEECEDLHQMVKKGTFKRPSIAELDKKIRSMHRDIMSHWIDRELSRLAKKIERANDKGWRAELFDLIDERELLRTRKEQMRLLDEIPSIIADMEDLPAAALETTSMENDDLPAAALETSMEIDEAREVQPLMSLEHDNVLIVDSKGNASWGPSFTITTPEKTSPFQEPTNKGTEQTPDSIPSSRKVWMSIEDGLESDERENEEKYRPEDNGLDSDERENEEKYRPEDNEEKYRPEDNGLESDERENEEKYRPEDNFEGEEGAESKELPEVDPEISSPLEDFLFDEEDDEWDYGRQSICFCYYCN